VGVLVVDKARGKRTFPFVKTRSGSIEEIHMDAGNSFSWVTSYLPSTETAHRSNPLSLPSRRFRCPRRWARAVPVSATDDSDDLGDGGIAQREGILEEKYGHLRGRSVKTVADALRDFNDTFNRPVFSVYSSIINEFLASTHLARVCAAFRYDPIFGYGFTESFNDFLANYPNEGDRTLLFDAIIKALDLDRQQIRDDAEAVRSWLESVSSEDEVFSLLDSPGNNKVAQALHYVATAPYFEWFYSRVFGIGLFKIMEKVGVKIDQEALRRWSEKLNISIAKLEDEWASYGSAIEKMKVAEQLFAEVTAREKKKVAEKLAEQARELEEKATKAEKEKGGVA